MLHYKVIDLIFLMSVDIATVKKPQSRPSNALLLALGTSVKQLGQFDNVYFPLAVSFYN